MAEGTIGGTPISDLPPSSFAYCEPGDGAVSTRCHFAIRDKRGKADPAHVRNALARLSGSPFESKARPKVEAAARECGIGGKTMQPMKATVIDDDAFRLLAIPFGGPIPSKASPLGVDLDGEWFSRSTDIRPGWFRSRVVDWHHGTDRLLGRTVLGKATDLHEEDNGWWVTVWLNHGERRLDLIRRLAEQGAQLYGSSESANGLTEKASTGEILRWPYLRQTLSTSPQNTYSVLRPMKATLDELRAEGSEPTAQFFDDLARYVDDLVSPPDDLAGDSGAKAGRVLAARNESRLREGIDQIEANGWNPVLRAQAIAQFRAILDELDRYLP